MQCKSGKEVEDDLYTSSTRWLEVVSCLMEGDAVLSVKNPLEHMDMMWISRFNRRFHAMQCV